MAIGPSGDLEVVKFLWPADLVRFLDNSALQHSLATDHRPLRLAWSGPPPR